MIRIAVIDNKLDNQSNQIHKIDSDGPFQSVSSYNFTDEILDCNHVMENKIIVFNIKVNGNQGKELIRQIRSKKAKVCLLITSDDDDPNDQARTLAGAEWIVYNDRVNNSLIKEINHILDNGEPIDPKITNRVIRFIKQPQIKHWESTILLTNREVEIMNLISNGYMYKEIATKLGISIQTVKNHIKKIYSKLHVTNRSQAILKFNKSI